MNTSIVEYQPIAAVLADLSGKYKGVLYDVSTIEGMRAAKEGKREIAQYRIALEKSRVNLKEESLKRGRLIDSEAKPIAAALETLETPIDNQIKAKERAEQAAREAAIKAEQDRILAQQAAVKKAEEEKLAAERAAIAKERAEMERARVAQAESDRQARLKIEEEQRASRLKIEEEARQARLAQQARDEVTRQKREAEEAALKAERDRIEAERRAVEETKRKADAEAEAKAKAVRDAEEAKQREEQRLKNELLDGRRLLTTFVKNYGKRAEFESIAGIINTFLEQK